MMCTVHMVLFDVYANSWHSLYARTFDENFFINDGISNMICREYEGGVTDMCVVLQSCTLRYRSPR